MAANNHQPGYLTIPIEGFSSSTSHNHQGKPFWVHLNGNSNSYVAFVILTEREPTGLGSSAARIAYKVIIDGNELEQFRLDHLLKLAAIDEKNGKLGGESDAKLHLVARKPLVAMKYMTEDFDVKRNQIKFFPHPDTGFERFCQQLTRNGLTLREPTTKSGNGQSGAPGGSQPLMVPANTHDFQAAGPVKIQLPTYQNCFGVPLPLASSQTQGQRLDACSAASQSQGQSQPQSIPVTNFPPPSQPSYENQIRSTVFHQGVPTISAHPTHPNSGMLSRQGTTNQTEQDFPSPMLDRLKQRPVERKLSFSTPPSSGQAPPYSDAELFIDSQRMHAYHHASQSPLMHHPLAPRNRNAGPDQPVFLQQSSPLRNEIVFHPEGRESHISTMVGDTNQAPPMHDLRPATAPAYPGMAPSVALADDDQRPPKRTLPFPPLKDTKVGRAATGISGDIEVVDKSALRTQSHGQMSLKRPATSPADAQASKGAKASQKSRTATTRKKASAAAVSKKLDDAMMAFLDETEPSEERPAQKLRTQSSAKQRTKVDISVSATSEDQTLPHGADTVHTANQRPQERSTEHYDPPAGQNHKEADSTQDQGTLTKLQASNACVTCRKRRIKCDMNLPTCEKCKQGGQTCDYTPPKRNRSRPTQAPARQAIKPAMTKPTGTVVTTAKAKCQSMGTQASLVSFNVHLQRSGTSQPALDTNINFRDPEVAAVASVMQAVNKLVGSHNSSVTSDAATGRIVAGSDQIAGASLGNTKEERAEAIEQRICELLEDDAFLEFCDEVEEVCDRTGISI